VPVEDDTEGAGTPYGVRISELAEEEPDRVGITFVALDGTERPLTTTELEARANQVGRAMAARGVGAGDRVGLELRNSPELVACLFGAWKIGAAPVPMRWDLPDWERERVVKVLDGRLVVTERDTSILQDADRQPTGPLPPIVPPIVNGICSSGSTGTPKVIMSTRPGAYDPDLVRPFPIFWGVELGRQRILCPTTLYHTNGFHTMMNYIAGDTVVVMEKFEAARVVDLIERHRITTFTATSTMLQRISQVPGLAQRDLSSIVWVLQGAQVIAPNLVQFWIDLLGADKFYMSYGMTEGLGLAAIRGDQWLTHRGSVGRGIRDTEIKILDGDQREVPRGEVGEIYLRSPFTGGYGYLGDAGNLPTTPDGFSTAADLGWMDEEGFLYVVDRRVDMIVSGGANVYPAEVEAALFEHPGIADVVVVGLQDERWGRRVHAIVEPADKAHPPTPDEVIAFAKSHLAAYKVPKTVEIVDSIPRSAATKVNRGALVAERGG
jgi:bile acid-coenzyme A ligase